jgi:hypothetical protein
MFGLDLWNPAKKSDKAEVTRDKAERSDMSGLEPDIFGLGLWNLNKELNKAERSDMFGQSL